MIRNTYSCTPKSKLFSLAVLLLLLVNTAGAQIAPVAGDDLLTTNEDTALSDSVSQNDSDADGPAANYTQVTSTINGTLLLNADGTFTYSPNLNFNGTDSFVYSLCDGGTPELCDTATAIITIAAVNDAPSISQIGGNLPEDMTATYCPAIADVDTGQILTVSICNGPANGTAIADTNCITFTPNSNFNGNDSICVTVCDNGTPVLCDTVVIQFTITPVNDEPLATNDVNATPEDTPLSGDVTGNDSDLDGPFTNVTIVANPINGIVVLNTNGTYTYTPNANYNGADTFIYSYCDGGTPELCDTATAIITIAAVNDAPTISQMGGNLPEDNTAVACPNIADADTGQVLTVSICNGPFNGTATVDTNCISYTPNSNFTGNDSICMTVCDNGVPVLCDTVVVAFTLTPVNDAPLIKNDANTTAEDTPVNGDVTINDIDLDGPLPNVTLVANPANGAVVLNSNGTYTYTPDANYNGVDTFTYSYCDGGTPQYCDTAFAVITITPVNDTPTINQLPVVLSEDSSTTFCPVIADIDTGHVLTVSLCNGTVNGTATVDTNCIAYTPNNNFNGNDSICVIVCDNGTPVLCDTLIVQVTVSPVNDPPSVTQVPVTVNENSTVTFCPVLTDIDAGDVLTLGLCSGAANGTAATDTNCVTYSPTIGFEGTDSICLVVCDNGTPVLCDTTIVQITVSPLNAPPLAGDDNVNVNEDGTLNATVLANDTDADGNLNATSVTLVSGTANGALTLNADGTFTYTPAADYNGTDTFTYSVCDLGVPSLCDTATVAITVVPANDAPVITPATIALTEDSLVTVCTTVIDADAADTHTTVLCASPANGAASVTVSAGLLCITYSPNSDFNGADSVCIIVCDNGTPAACDTIIIPVAVTPVNDAPVAVDDNITVAEEATANGDVSTNDTDADGPGAIYTLAGNPSNGTMALGTNGDYTYTPNVNFEGCDTAVISVCDGGSPNLCDTSLFIVCATPVNDAPVAVDDNTTTTEDTPVNGNVSTNDSDTDGPGATYTIAGNPAHGTLVLGTDGNYIYTPNTGFEGCDTALVSLCDGGTPNLCDTSMLIVCVTPGNNPPVAQNDGLTSPEDATLLINVLANDVDPEGSLGNPTILNGPAHGTVTVNSDGTITYQPEADFNGTDSFTYIICDGGTPVLCDTATVILTITPVDDIPLVTVQPLVTDEDVTGSTCFDYILDNLQDSVSVAIVCSPADGTVDSVTASNGQICVVYTPDQEFNGEDSVCVQLCDLAGGGCITVTVAITVNPIQDGCLWLKGISPNGDGQNDSFWINCNDDFAEATLRIFNRWGDEVYRSQGHYNNDWYGRNQTDKDLPDGTYFYIYDYGDGVHKAHAGFITVNR